MYGLKMLLKGDACAGNQGGNTRKIRFIKLLPAITLLGFILGSGKRLNAYTVITSTQPALEEQLIASATAQFVGTVVPNPFVGNTWSINITAPNPLYNPPLTNKQLLDSLVTVDSYTYVFGWGDGTTYTRAQDAIQSDALFQACTSTKTFATPPPGISTTSWVVPHIDSTTCQFVTNYISDSIWAILDSTPTIIPGDWQ